MAEDGFLPQQLTRLHPRFGTARRSALSSRNYLCAARDPQPRAADYIYAWLRVATTLMTALSAWRLRQKRMPRWNGLQNSGGQKQDWSIRRGAGVLGIVATVGSL